MLTITDIHKALIGEITAGDEHFCKLDTRRYSFMGVSYL